MMRRALVAAGLTGLALLTAAPAAAGPPDAYSAAEIRGSVVDAETKQPLEGVHVVAQWIPSTAISPFQMHAYRGAPLQIMETVTDAKGEYYVPPWGPKPRPTFSRLEWGFDPILTFFKPGYRALDRSNYSPPPENEEAISRRFSRWHGRTIALKPFRGTPEEWLDTLEHVQTRLQWGLPTDNIPRRINDHWRYFPRTVLSIVEQRRLLPERLRHHVRDLDTWEVTEQELRTLLKQGGQPR